MMTQKDLAAIKRRLNPDKRSPVMIRGCYLDPKGEILSTFHLPVSMLAQEENEKYMGLFKKTLSGTPGQNLIPVAFSTEQVNGDDAYALLMGLCRTELSDEDMAMSLYDCIIRWLRSEYAGTQQSVEEQQKGNNWLILLLYDSFDVPYTHPDGEDDLEMSENIFNYMLCAICPVQQGKDQLSYDAQDGSKRYVTEIVANEVEFLDSRNAAPQAGGFGAPAPAAPQSAPVDGFGPSIPDEEIPF